MNHSENERHSGAAEPGRSRRDFLRQGLTAGAGMALLSGAVRAQTPESTPSPSPEATASLLYPGAIDERGEYVLPALPYPAGALAPHIDAETMTLHHGKHHAGYVKGLKAAEAALAEARKSGDFSQIESLTRKAAFYGAGHFLHCIFWASMSPGSSKPSASLARAINRDFDSLESFGNQFRSAAETVEGSGWGLLTWSIPAKKLVVLQALNHQQSSQWGNVPLLAIDVWEHAYYKQYSDGRTEYVEAFMNLIDWDGVGMRYETVRKMAG